MSQHELSIELELDAPAEKLFRCYADANLLKQWFAPKPWSIKSTDIDFRAGGRMNFVMASPEGEEYPQSGIYLEIVPNKKIVTTDAVTPSFEPSGPFMIAEITFEDLGGGKTRYTGRARHWNDEDRKKHEEMGFHPGWNAAADQLEEFVKKI